MMFLPELAGLEEAEEFFDALGVPYDSRVLAAYRLHVLRRFGLCAAAFLAERPNASEGELRAALRSVLRESHDLFTRGRPAEERLFGRRGGGPLVTLRKP